MVNHIIAVGETAHCYTHAVDFEVGADAVLMWHV
jgi:hypothetical protein